jgi:hypothetical protein
MLPRVPDAAELADAIRRDGYVVVRDLLTPREVDDARSHPGSRGA